MEKRLGAAVGYALLAAMVAGQVASGLQARPVALTSVVVVLLAGCAAAFAASAYGRRGAVAFACAVAVGYAAEWIGVRTGLPFGAYHYTGVLRPQIGGVPVIVALAWGGMGLAAHAVGAAAARGVPRLVCGALALTAWDLFLDPQMLRLDLWRWHEPGPYRGVPLGNFAGWLLVSLLLMALIDRLAGARRPPAGLLVLYAVMAVMETVGFAAVFRPPDPLVAALGGGTMGLLAVLAWTRRWPR
ncbi:carotenoid biosynthesis protein [Actinomadura parmotrematis]|uniref:Carotenoid biosynthesis protein n=1 Tax=Actinomadura parmotrematis TaxID=2864039 RepID=A0ABS7FYI0_9ACTN|nr:carotenoid biosynthesis protein [Actinomadura parmotrematis]MBW8485495.1 carotenoid biosynthesis protein [Actinomadura parmotrematis]